MTDFFALLLGLPGVLAGAGVTVTGTTIALILIMIGAVIFIDLITTGSMERETGSMILCIGRVLLIGTRLPVTGLELPIRFEPPIIVLACKGRTQVQLEAVVVITMVVTPRVVTPKEAITMVVTPRVATPKEAITMVVTPRAVTTLGVVDMVAVLQEIVAAVVDMVAGGKVSIFLISNKVTTDWRLIR
jgi:hypothetical protein